MEIRSTHSELEKIGPFFQVPIHFHHSYPQQKILATPKIGDVPLKTLVALTETHLRQ